MENTALDYVGLVAALGFVAGLVYWKWDWIKGKF